MRTPEYHWVQLTAEAPFAPRDGAGALIFNGRLWLLGGWNPNDKVNFPRICNSEVWSSADGRDWRLETRQAPWEGRHTAGYAVHRGRMWIVGGDANQGHYQNDVWSSADGVNWDCIADSVPWAPRVMHHTVVFRDKIWIMGGQTMPASAPSEGRFYSDVWCSEDGAHWQCITDDVPWAPRGMIGGNIVFQDRIWIVGGGTYDTPEKPQRLFYNDVWSSGDGIEWRHHTDKAPWKPRQYHEVAVFDGRMWVMEGWSEVDGRSNLNDVWHSTNGIDWVEVPHTPWAPRHAASLFASETGLWMVAGNNMTSDSWKLERRDG